MTLAPIHGTRNRSYSILKRCDPRHTIKRGGSRRISSTEVFRVAHQPRSRSPSIVDMLKTRNSWLLPPSIVNDAPRTIGRSGFVKAEDGRKHTKDEQENPHGNLQSRSGLSRQVVLKLRWRSIYFIPTFATGRRAGRRVERATRKNFANREKTEPRSEAYSFLIRHAHLLSSGCPLLQEKRHGS